MSDELIEAAARAICAKHHPRSRDAHWQNFMADARAAYAVLAPALIEQGVRMGLDAAAHCSEHLNGWGSPRAPELADHIAKCIRALDPATIARNEP
jgi:hypothetical protein